MGEPQSRDEMNPSAAEGEPVVWPTLERLRDDIRTRVRQLRRIHARIQELGGVIDAVAFRVAELEDEHRGSRRRPGRGRGRPPGPKEPTVVDLAVDILKERGGPLPCEELAAAIRARGVDSGNNERSLRMSAGKGRRLRALEGDIITLA